MRLCNNRNNIRGVKQFRHKFIYPSHLIFTNLYPEHIESHGGFEKYKEAELKTIKEIKISNKKNGTVVSNTDSEHGKDFDAVVDYTRVRFIKKTLQSIQKETQDMHSWEHRRGKR